MTCSVLRASPSSYSVSCLFQESFDLSHSPGIARRRLRVAVVLHVADPQRPGALVDLREGQYHPPLVCIIILGGIFL